MAARDGGVFVGRADVGARPSRAVWLLFLPFIFINLAHWMLPPAAKQRRRRSGRGGACCG